MINPLSSPYERVLAEHKATIQPDYVEGPDQHQRQRQGRVGRSNEGVYNLAEVAIKGGFDERLNNVIDGLGGVMACVRNADSPELQQKLASKVLAELQYQVAEFEGVQKGATANG